MRSLWSDREAQRCKNDPLALRVYTSRLLGQNPDLVLHGGGNTSVKTRVPNLFGLDEDILFIKGSGWDLATIEAAGFAPVKLDVLKKMVELKKMSDGEMVKYQRAAMIEPGAPTPSVEAILHAIIPFAFVDHTHADSVVTISNTPGGENRIRDIYGPRVLVVPYVMPGFILARKVYELTRDFSWDNCEGIVLLNHGIFTFGESARESYEKMIRQVSRAERYLRMKKAVVPIKKQRPKEELLALASLRRRVSAFKGSPMLAALRNTDAAVEFSNLPNVFELATRGPLTPDHVIRTKPWAAVLKADPLKGVERFSESYIKYFNRQNDGTLSMLDPAPRWAVWPGHGVLVFGGTFQDLRIVSDITDHTLRAIRQAEILGGWKPLSEKDIFEIEYWELEQAKLKKTAKSPVFQGKVALVTGAASGIGKACVEQLWAEGAVVAALDVNPDVQVIFKNKGIIPFVCDMTDSNVVQKAIEQTVRQLGGLDILVSNAGLFPSSENIARMSRTTWDLSLSVNLTSHQNLMQCAIPFLERGLDPAMVIIGSKNVPAPGPGASAYSVAKAGLTQLARVAAMELAAKGIRVNIVHPNQVFDTAIWTKDVLEKRARHYHMTVDQYKSHNLLRTEITSRDVARLVCVMAGPVFSKTTGAQVPIDGGNERVI